MPHHSLIEHTEKLTIRDLQAAIPRGAASAFLQVEGSFGVQEIQVIGQLTNLRNGYRYYLVCSKCGRAYLSLYRRDFGAYACRNCLGLLYASSLRIEL